MSATLKDIYLAAHDAAEKLVTVTSPLELAEKKLAAFTESKLDTADYIAFIAHVEDRITVLKNFANVPAPSAVAAAVAEAEAKKKAATQAA